MLILCGQQLAVDDEGQNIHLQQVSRPKHDRFQNTLSNQMAPQAAETCGTDRAVVI